MMNGLWSWTPQVISHVFWYRKKAFQLHVDTYDDWVMFAVQAGSFRYRIGEASGTAGFGDAVLCPPGTAFYREVMEPVTFHFYTLRWRAGTQRDLVTGATTEIISDGDESEAVEGAHPSGGLPDALPVHLTWLDHNRLSSTYFYMEQLTRLRPEEPKPSQWSHFLHDLWQQYWMEQEVSRQTEMQKGYDSLMQEAEQWLRRQAFEPVMLKELSAHLGLSPVQFTRRFHAAYGVKPMDYLTSLRMQKAKTLLLESDMNLEQIAERCGYENGFYLSRVFSRTMKISPSQYRKKYRV